MKKSSIISYTNCIKLFLNLYKKYNKKISEILKKVLDILHSM